MTTAQWITVVAVVVSALAILAGLKNVRDQLRIAIFLEYTKRYSKIMQNMPFEAREPGGRYRLSSQPKDERYHILSVFREYLNMCSEEKWLYGTIESITQYGAFGNAACGIPLVSHPSLRFGKFCVQNMTNTRIFKFS
jgi:hypothetical protein